MSNSNNLDSIQKRFETNFNTLEAKIESLTTSNLFGIWSEEFTVFLKDVLTALKTDLEKIFENDEEAIESILITLNHRLDSLASLIESILNSLCKNTSVHEFVSSVLRDLKFEHKIPYLICARQSLGTAQIIASCRLYFPGPLYESVNEILDKFQKKFNDFLILFLPPTVLENKKYWSLILHEIGHIINEIYELTEKHNKKVEQPSPFNQNFRNYFHGREFVSDYIASLYCGPVFYESLNEYLNELDVVPPELNETHPNKDARLFFLQEVAGKYVDNPTIIQDPPKIDLHNRVENLDKIILDTHQKIFGDSEIIYQIDDTELQKAAEHLKIPIPYIGPPRILLNAYAKYHLDIIKTIKEKTKQEEKEISNNLSIIIEDSIRLTNMKKTFDSTE